MFLLCYKHNCSDDLFFLVIADQSTVSTLIRKLYCACTLLSFVAWIHNAYCSILAVVQVSDDLSNMAVVTVVMQSNQVMSTSCNKWYFCINIAKDSAPRYQGRIQEEPHGQLERQKILYVHWLVYINSTIFKFP